MKKRGESPAAGMSARGPDGAPADIIVGAPAGIVAVAPVGIVAGAPADTSAPAGASIGASAGEGQAGKSLTRKLFESRIVEGRWEPGSRIGIAIDQTLTQDATGTMAYLQFETLGIDRVRTSLSVSYIDHNTLQVGFENADDHRYLAGVARRYGIRLSRAGNGICHQVHVERFGKPGASLLGSDSHTPTSGALGMIAIGAGGLDVALAMAGMPFSLVCPRVVGILLRGRLRPWVSAKDVVLAVLARFTTRGNVDTVFEYRGEGVSGLTVPERATIANMGAECGVTTSVFPSDGSTLAFMRSQGREGDWIPLSADMGAVYDLEFELDLDTLEPLVAAPHSPGNVRTVRGASTAATAGINAAAASAAAGKDAAAGFVAPDGIAVSQVCVGSCTNSSFRDLAIVAEMLGGRTAHRDLDFVVAPGSRQVLEAIARSGHLEKLIASGARIVEPSCSFCVGNGHSPASGSVSVRTSNRNFEARSGTADALVYIASPETAAACVITGRLTDPRDLGIEWPDIAIPERFDADDRMVVDPSGDETRLPRTGDILIVRGPNIGEPPSSSPCPEHLEGMVAIVVGDRITTDHIIPAGPRMKYRSNIAVYSNFVFENVDPGFAARASGIRESGRSPVIVAGLSYGQGSSREHAAICPAHLGVKVVLARSFERIHSANLVNFGILPLGFADESEYLRISPGDRLSIRDLRGQVAAGKNVIVFNESRGYGFEAFCSLVADDRDVILAGGRLALAAHRSR